MTDIDIKVLRVKAEAATPGPWGAGDAWVFTDPVYPDDNRLSNVFGMNFADHERADAEHARGVRNAAYIAAVGPDVVLALLDRLEAAEARLADADSKLAAVRAILTARAKAGSWDHDSREVWEALCPPIVKHLAVTPLPVRPSSVDPMTRRNPYRRIEKVTGWAFTIFALVVVLGLAAVALAVSWSAYGFINGVLLPLGAFSAFLAFAVLAAALALMGERRWKRASRKWDRDHEGDNQ
ncbi:MAG: hypothetical protein CMH36_09990 [Microbacterium sp.]|uniref:Uncharacterized protein n=1 Tax=Microbacterium ginsengisoli TaxID=400772 RepID=A0A3C1KHU4_9MICO|nr:ead/Ea22-like family protein [Microbacterium sp. 4NA327F11]MAL07139.1 hypothetical protein [Microbacterium sp.]MCK9917234.1 ead/Ea22-like family protein [Microbacteriaceae bacterium K1510]HAN25826.1 hypothetical protein [Microbacterium ginsengisoli]